MVNKFWPYLAVAVLGFGVGVAVSGVASGRALEAAELRRETELNELEEACRHELRTTLAFATEQCSVNRRAFAEAMDAARLEYRKLSDLLADCRGIDVGQDGWRQ